MNLDGRLEFALDELRQEREAEEHHAHDSELRRHYVTFYSPGTFVAETTTKEVVAWDVDEVTKTARSVRERHAAIPYGFQFTTRVRGKEDFDSRVEATSPFYWLGGTVRTLQELETEADPSTAILRSNMRSNHWGVVITNTNSWDWTQPLNDTDIILPFSLEVDTCENETAD